MKEFARWVQVLPILLIAFSVGCGGSDIKTFKTYPAKGKVTIDGAGPLKTGEVVFTSDKVTARGTLKDDGTFALSTNNRDSGDGAPAGTYEVAVTGAFEKVKDSKDPYALVALIDPIYGDFKTSGLKYTVEAKSNQFDITVKKPPQK